MTLAYNATQRYDHGYTANQHNDDKYNDILYNDTKHQHYDPLQNDIKNCDTKYNEIINHFVFKLK